MGMGRMKIKEIYPQLFLYTFSNQYELASTFIRLQEFYESPYKQIRGKYFRLEKFMDLYAKDQKKNKFTYFEDWNGFNVPSNIISKFINKFNNDFTNKEINLIKKLPLYKYELSPKFYIIGIVEKGKDTIEHETAHGLYYLNKEYRKKMLKLINEMPIPLRQMAEKYLKKIGYCKAIMKDELQSYFATGLDKGMISIWHYIIYQSYIQKIKKIFKIYSKVIKLC